MTIYFDNLPPKGFGKRTTEKSFYCRMAPFPYHKLPPLNETTPEESGVGAIETKTNDYFRSRTEVAYPRI